MFQDTLPRITSRVKGCEVVSQRFGNESEVKTAWSTVGGLKWHCGSPRYVEGCPVEGVINSHRTELGWMKALESMVLPEPILTTRSVGDKLMFVNICCWNFQQRLSKKCPMDSR
jgi:hypothetical protein